MHPVDRRRFIGLTTGGLVLPRFAIGQADDRPTINIAVQQVATSASLEVVRERSNVGERVQQSIFETLIAPNLKSKLEPIPGLAESWKRIDERTVEFSLRKGVKFHNGDEMTADDVVFTFGPERMFGYDYDSGTNKTLFTTVLARGLQFATQDRVGTAAAQVIFGSSGGTVMAIAILVSTFGCSNGLILAGARVYYAMARDGLFFKKVGALNSRRVPAAGLVYQGIMA
mgnify:CR=1 FL=1